jgi:hypothetical protein
MSQLARQLREKPTSPEHDALTVFVESRRDEILKMVVPQACTNIKATLTLEQLFNGPPRIFVDAYLVIDAEVDHTDCQWYWRPAYRRSGQVYQACCPICNQWHEVPEPHAPLCKIHRTALFEFKPTILSLGELLRQINLYRSIIDPTFTFLVTPDDTFDDILKRQKILVLHPHRDNDGQQLLPKAPF